MSFPHFLQELAKKYGESTALSIHESGTWKSLSFSGLAHKAAGLGAGLRQAGLRKGDRVAILGESSLEWVTHFFGVLVSGGVAVPLDVKLTSSELGHIIAHAEPTIILASRDFRETARQLKIGAGRPTKVWIIDGEGDENVGLDIASTDEAAHSRAPALSADDLAVICYTSGTSGAPKGVMLKAGSLLFEAEAVRAASERASGGDGTSGQEVILSILPLNHLYGLSAGLIYSLHCGMELCFAHDLSPGAISFCLRERKVTRVLAVPLFAKILMKGIQRKVSESASTSGELAFRAMVRSMGTVPVGPLQSVFFKKIIEGFGGSLKQVICGGSELDPHVYSFFRAIGVPIYIGYGLTETGPVISVNTVGAHRRSSVGKVIPGVQVRIDRENPSDRMGEIVTRGPNVMLGYYKNPELTSEVLTQDGWFHTGDLGWIDRAGFLHVRGRKKSLIVLGNGKKVHPEEVEGVLTRSPLVREICVVGLPTEGEEAVVAVVRPSDELLASSGGDEEKMQQELRAALAELCSKLAPFKRPRKIMLRREAFPMTTSMKIKRGELLKELLRRS